MSDPSPAVRATILLVLVACLALWVAPRRPAQVAGAAQPLPPGDTLTFEVRYQGRGVEDTAMHWHARVEDPVPGSVVVRMEYAGDSAERQMPMWPVNARLSFAADDPRASFAAELSGTMNWRTGEMRVAGLVSEGARLRTALEQRLRVRKPELGGEGRVVFYPRSGEP
jgi:hypothetical protein